MTRPVPTRELIMNALKGTDKCVRQIAKEINIDRTYVGNVLTRLCTAYEVEAYQKFDAEMGRNVSYYTIRKETKNAQKYYFSSDKRLQRLQKQTDALTRDMRKSSKTHVGISTIYNG